MAHNDLFENNESQVSNNQGLASSTPQFVPMKSVIFLISIAESVNKAETVDVLRRHGGKTDGALKAAGN